MTTEEVRTSLAEFLRAMPKVELHLHLEGTLEPELMFELARRNGVQLPFVSIEDVRVAYDFSDLDSFLRLYYEGAAVLRTERDFYDLTTAYLDRAYQDGVRHAEVFFDPQTHTARGVAFRDVVSGIHRALAEAEHELGLTSGLIMCFLRDAGVASARATLSEALEYQGWLTAVGLDSAEAGYPPEIFAEVFVRARANGLRAVAHAGEEGPAEYVRGALDALGAARIDHGIRSLEDPALVDRLVRERVPLTVCPLSNVRLKVVRDMASHPLRTMLDRGMIATVNSDDPAYFGGYLSDNFIAAQEGLGLDRAELLVLAANAIEAAFVGEARRVELRVELDAFAATAFPGPGDLRAGAA
ncbi:MAG: adenosine deaminase [Thermoleophilia bacterium]